MAAEKTLYPFRLHNIQRATFRGRDVVCFFLDYSFYYSFVVSMMGICTRALVDEKSGEGDGVLGEINRVKVACTQTEENMDKKKGPAQKDVLFSIAGIQRDDRQHGTWMDAMSGKQANCSVSQKVQITTLQPSVIQKMMVTFLGSLRHISWIRANKD